MKKVLLFTLSLVITSYTVSAQGFGWGIKAGINVANENAKADGVSVSADSKIGFTGGMFMDYFGRTGFGFSAELLYSGQGAKMDNISIEGIAGTVNATDQLHYLNIPLLLNYRIVNGLAIKAGIQPGFLLSAETKVEASGNSASVDNEGIKSFDFAIPVGASYEFPVGLILDARYNIGVANLDDSGISGLKVRNNVFAFTLGYRF